MTIDNPIDLLKGKLLAPDLVQAVIKRNGPAKLTFRPVEIKRRKMVQVSVFDGRKTDVKNYSADDLGAALDTMLAEPFRSAFVTSGTEDTQIQITKKGKPIVSFKIRAESMAPDLRHDRTIRRALPEGEPDEFLQKIGMMTADGRIKADRQRKFQQINEFIRLVTETADLRQTAGDPFLIVDFGCGNAYLTFALHHYISVKLGIPCELIGIDQNAESIARDVAKAASLGADTIRFEQSKIADYRAPRNADMVVALHACDTATDEALAQALRYRSKFVFAAPCCQHHLQVQMNAADPAEAHLAIFRDGILKERLGDLVTDTLRAMLLRIAGYKVDVIEFTSPDHTAKNLLIRARRLETPASTELIQEYRALKSAFRVMPYLETLLPPEILALLPE